jgi:hypothetical protein
LAERFAVLLFATRFVVRFAEALSALRDLAFDLPRAAFADLRAFFGAARFVVAFRADDFLADDFFAVFLAGRFRRGGCAAIGGTNKGSETSPSAANGIAAASFCSTFGGSSAFNASDALFAISFTVSVNRSSIDLSLSMMPPAGWFLGNREKACGFLAFLVPPPRAKRAVGRDKSRHSPN